MSTVDALSPQDFPFAVGTPEQIYRGTSRRPPGVQGVLLRWTTGDDWVMYAHCTHRHTSNDTADKCARREIERLHRKVALGGEWVVLLGVPRSTTDFDPEAGVPTAHEMALALALLRELGGTEGEVEQMHIDAVRAVLAIEHRVYPNGRPTHTGHCADHPDYIDTCPWCDMAKADYERAQGRQP